MKKNIKKVNKKISIKEILIFTLIVFIAMTGIVLIQNIDNLDTMWVFSFASKIADGAVPYADFNMVVTPLSSQVTALFLSVFGNTMMVSAFIGVIYGTILFLMQYLILRKLNVSKKVSIFLVLISFLLISSAITDSYNILAFMLVHILFFIEICKIRYDKYVKLTQKEKYILKKNKMISYTLIYNIVTGIILGLVILAKQNIGFVAGLAIIIYYFTKCIYSDIKFRNVFFQLLTKGIFCILVISIEILYLFLSGALYQFIDYTILGLSSFANKVNVGFIEALFSTNSLDFNIITSNIQVIFTYVFMFASSLIIAPIKNMGIIFSFIFLIVMLVIKCANKMGVKNKLDTNVMMLSICFMLVGIVISIPLANQYHLTLTATFIEYLFLMNFVKIIPISKWLNKNISKISYYIMIIIPIIMGISYIIIYSLFAYKSQIDKFENMYISQSTDSLIINVVAYIDNYEKKYNQPIYVITSNGVMYSLAMDRNNGIFDLPQYGNLGKQDYMSIINKLDSMKNFSVMIYTNDGKIFWQEPKEISQYIRENYEYVENIDMYDVYCKP